MTRYLRDRGATKAVPMETKLPVAGAGPRERPFYKTEVSRRVGLGVQRRVTNYNDELKVSCMRARCRIRKLFEDCGIARQAKPAHLRKCVSHKRARSSILPKGQLFRCQCSIPTCCFISVGRVDKPDISDDGMI